MWEWTTSPTLHPWFGLACLYNKIQAEKYFEQFLGKIFTLISTYSPTDTAKVGIMYVKNDQVGFNVTRCTKMLRDCSLSLEKQELNINMLT